MSLLSANAIRRGMMTGERVGLPLDGMIVGYSFTNNLDDILGVNDIFLEKIKKSFPKLKVIARGDMIKVIGDDKEIDIFEEKFSLILLLIGQ